MLFSILGPNSLPVVVFQPDGRHANRQLLCWSGMTDTKVATSGLNEEAHFSYFFTRPKRVLTTGCIT